MLNNLDLFSYSLSNPEPIIDEFYVKKGNLIISDDLKNPSSITKINSHLVDCISAYNFALEKHDDKLIKEIIYEIKKTIFNKNINFTEFVSFWPIVDISYSSFKKIDSKLQEQILQKITTKYIELRHNLYKQYGYSPVTLQVGKDAKAHKESGNLGIIKVGKLLNSYGFVNYDKENLENFNKYNKSFIESDKKGKKLFNLFLKKHDIKFTWSKSKDNKMPDILFKSKKSFFIVEHKHMKESGGGQDKQINEVISFISRSEKNRDIHYISFLDGVYFNLFIKQKREGKIRTQLLNIKKSLKNNKNNYFVNTAGFIKLLEKLD